MGRGQRSRRGGTLERALPLAYFVGALALTVALLPTILRQPPPEQNQTAELSPDAPPDDDNQSIVASLNRASSSTAGGGTGESAGVEVGDGIAPVAAAKGPTCRHGFGRPPRQAESVYSPLCTASFSGDNGGVTAHNVFPTEIRVGYWHGLAMPGERGLVPTEPPFNESARLRTVRVLQKYFNERYEFYGRTLRINAIPGEGNTVEEQRNQAVEQDAAGTFAASHLNTPFCEEAAHRKMLCYNVNSATVAAYERHRPFWWSYYMSFDENEAITAEYACKKLIGRNAEFAGGAEQGRPRAIGIIKESSENNDFHRSTGTTRQLMEQCGYDPPVEIEFSVTAENTATLATAMTRMRQEGITTVIASVTAPSMLGLMSAADSGGYFPEWFHVNSYGLDLNAFARLLPPTQSRHLSGLSGWELPRPYESTDCYRAYKAIDAFGIPDPDVCEYAWPNLEQIIIGLQLAGPRLTPQSFEKGLYGHRVRAAENWAIGGGYGPREHGFVDTFTEQWWDQSAIDPNDGAQGAYRFTQGGRRFGRGEFDTVTRAFQEGVTGTT